MEEFLTPAFWLAVGQIIMIDILLGGDNAVVIALACRRLPAKQRTQGILWGTAGAIVLRIILIFFALTLLAIPFLKLVGALLLVWIGVKLLLPEHDEGHANIEGSDKLWGAVKTVIVADLVMSVDNVIAIAGAAESSGSDHGMALVIFGVLVSIPIIVWGSQMVIKLMDRFPVIITAGGMLLGWIAGTMAVGDPAVANPDHWQWVPKLPQTDTVKYGAGIAGALLVLVLGKWIAARQAKPAAVAAAGAAPAAPTGRMHRILLAVDGSEPSARAVQHVLAMRGEFRDPAAVEVHLLNVQYPVPGDVSSFVNKETLQDYHRERADEAMAGAREALRSAGLPFKDIQRVGSPGQTIAEVAQAEQCDLVVMGTRGQGMAGSALLGSVAQAALEHSTVPVLLVK
ncbi:MAG: YjbE family putative metal transport protein [Rubrivivax sp.]|nr:YjbE family putative metal transport protein [Rubrivivax sp.]